ncbi:hypothetical protein [Aridibaculum aurantiacum]|uniref:hypothetical protein n=1 Tax=Aridibaculum aurantiacum TaxID=2810307 RepID=UPI001A959A68|nr:hypothetical protein [Aridibaculum aurantiacum]
MNSFSFLKTTTLSCLLIALLVSFSSCSRKIAFATSTVVPAAEGRVTVKRDANKNHTIEVNVTNLAPPNKLTPSRNVYVVWLQNAQNQTLNIGQLKSSSGLFSSTLKGSLRTVSVSKPTRVYITAEDNADVQVPGPQVVLNTPSF